MPRLEQLKSLIREPRTLIMGVLNVTPDSFSDGGEFLKPKAAYEHVRQMIAEGADIIDIGGQSTRPPGKTYGQGAIEVTEQQERERVVPILKDLTASYSSVLYSIDTVRSAIAKEAITLGADIINDVSAGTVDDHMFSIAAKAQAPIILMHGHGPGFPKASIEEYIYSDVTKEVSSWLAKRVEAAKAAGVPYILADCGFGFAKTPKDNMRLLKEHNTFSSLGVPMVLGVSRKSTIGKLLGDVPPKERVFGSIGAAVYAALNGAKIIRTHDVKATRDALAVVDKIRSFDE